MRERTETVIAAYRPKPGKDSALQKLVRQHRRTTAGAAYLAAAFLVLGTLMIKNIFNPKNCSVALRVQADGHTMCSQTAGEFYRVGDRSAPRLHFTSPSEFW